MSKNRKTRAGRASDIARLDVHDWLGNIIYRLKGKTNNKRLGVAILNTVQDVFNLTQQEIVEISAEIKTEDNSENDARERMRRSLAPRPVDWKK